MEKTAGKRGRQRYLIIGNYKINDVVMTGQRVVCLGPCGMGGRTKTPDGKKLPKRDCNSFLFRVEDQKWVKENNIPDRGTFTCEKDRVNWLLAAVD